MGSVQSPARLLCALLLAGCCGLAAAQAPAPGRKPASAEASGAAPQEAEVTARNAAAGFLVSSLATLAMLRDECEPLLGQGAESAPAIARAWWERNRADIETAYVWTDRYLRAIRRADAAQYGRLTRGLGAATAQVVRRNARHLFGEQMPTAERCRAALDLFAAPQLDVQQLGDNPGHERFAEYGRTLQRIRSEAGYTVPPHVKLDPERSLHYGLTASLLAAEAATRKRDGEAVRKAYAYMAGRGDAKAAYQLGAMHLNGELAEKDAMQAYRWFHRAWLLREPEGVNALGVLQRDGRVGPPNERLALALFQLAFTQATDPRAKERAQRNLAALSGKMAPADRHATACMTLRQIAEGVEQPLPPEERRSSRTAGPEHDRRLGDFLPQVSGGIPIFCG